MTIVAAIYSNKGGVGKTATAVNLAYMAARSGRKTINILAENILTASDFILVPLIPTTLSVRTFRQLLSFCRKKE